MHIILSKREVILMVPTESEKPGFYNVVIYKENTGNFIWCAENVTENAIPEHQKSC